MFKSKNPFCALLISTVFVGFVAAQPPPPAPPKKDSGDKGNVVSNVRQTSISNLSSAEKFSSTDGRFSISLPNNISGFSALTPKAVGINISGSQYQWRVKEGVIIIHYMDYLDENFSVKTEQDFANYFAGATDGVINSFKAKLISSSRIKLGDYNGIKVSFGLPNGAKGTHRNFLVGKRQYALTAVYAQDVPDAEKAINQAFDTLNLVSQSTIDEEVRRKVEQSTPPMLPQTPVTNKETSDAEDDNLKSKVKTVTEESEDLSGTWSVQGRHLDSIVDFNENGNRVKQLLFDSKATPFQITVYGYLDGARVSASKIISYENSPPPVMVISKSSEKETSKPDPRYSYRFEYKYTDGKLAETKWIMNNNSLWLRYVSNYKNNQLEELVYSQDGKINQKYVSILDDKGNEIERTNFNILKIRADGDTKYFIKYDSFDEKGNWTKKTTSQLVEENGKQIIKPSSINYRTITYYP